MKILQSNDHTGNLIDPSLTQISKSKSRNKKNKQLKRKIKENKTIQTKNQIMYRKH
jgi:hypothetical protein